MKKDLRNRYLDKRSKISKDEVFQKSEVIYNKVINSEVYKNSSQLLTYISHFNEVDTRNIIHKAWDDQKKVAVPKVEGKGIMKFYYINSMKDLRKGKFDILEPISEVEAIPTSQSLIIMPGVAFDRDKNRIGFGGGYYDRYLFKHDGISEKIALCYDFQLTDHIPSDSHDIKPDHIFTEKQTIWE